MKTSTQIIEEAVAMWKDISNGEVIDPEPFLRTALLQAMKTAVEEVTPEKKNVHEKDWQCEACSHNRAISDIEEKKRKFFEE
jgi:hypothetical protein